MHCHQMMEEMAEGGKKSISNTPFSDPVFKRISLKNGEINKMELKDLHKLAKALQLNVRGSSEVLKKRLKSHYRKVLMNEAQLTSLKLCYPYYIIIDFEATCEEKNSTKTGYLHEIIEFPAILVNSETMQIENIFHEYVKPGKNKRLSEYCMRLTGITQEQVDAASPFSDVLHRFEEWMHRHKLIGQSAIVTDGPWDMARFLYTQVKLSSLTYPKYAKRWVNVKKVFSNFYNQRKPSLDSMLNKLNFEFEGRRHSGIDDAKNITRVLIQLLKDGACVLVNERIDLSSFQSPHIPPVCDIVKSVVGDHLLLCSESRKLNMNGSTKEDSSNCSSCSESEKKVEIENDAVQTSLEESTMKDLSTLHIKS